MWKMSILEFFKGIVLDDIKNLMPGLLKEKKERCTIRKQTEELFSFVIPNDRRVSLVDELIRDLDSYNKEKSLDLIYDRIRQTLIRFEIEEGYADSTFVLWSKIPSKYNRDITQFLERKENNDKHSELVSLSNANKMEMINAIEKNKAGIVCTIEEEEQEICYRTNGILDLEFFNFDDCIFENAFNQAISNHNVVEIYSGCRDEAFYYVLYLLKNQSGRVRIVKSRDQYQLYKPDDDNIILVTNFPCVIEEERIPRCKVVIRLHDRAILPDNDAENKIVLKPRGKRNLKESLLRVYGNDSEKVEQLIERNGGYYSLIEADISSTHHKGAWEYVKTYSSDFENLEKLLFVESFDDKGREYLSSIGIEVDNLLLSAERIDGEHPKEIPFFTKEKHEFHGYKYNDYRVNSPDRVWKYISNLDEQHLVDSFLDYANTIFNNEKEIDVNVFQNLIYSTIRHRFDIGTSNCERIKSMAFKRLSSSHNKDKLLLALAELSPELTLKWFESNPQEINDENASTLFLLANVEETAEKTISLIINRCNVGEIKGNELVGSSSISNLLVEIFQVIQKTTVLSVESIIRAIDMAEPVAILKKTFMFVVPSRCGGCWSSINAKFRYRAFDDDFMSERSNEDRKSISKKLFSWILRFSDLEDLVSIINNRAVIFFVSSEEFLSSIKRVSNERSDIEKYPLYYSVVHYIHEEKNEYPKDKIDLLWEAERLLTPSSKMLEILPIVSFNIRRLRIEKKWNDYIKETEDILFCLVSNNKVTREEYLAAFSCLDSRLSSYNEYVNVYFKCFGYDSIDIDTLNSFPIRLQNRFLCEIMENSPEVFNKICPYLSSDIIFSIVCSLQYSKSKTLLSLLSEEKQIEYWKTINIHGVYTNDKQEIFDIVTKAQEVGNYELAIDLLSYRNDLFSGEELYALLKDNDKQYTSQINNFFEIENVFSKIRESSERGLISEREVIALEHKVLNVHDLCAPGTFFIRSFKKQPEIFAHVVHKIYKSDNDEIKEISKEELEYWYQLYLDLVYCPEAPTEGTKYKNDILRWFDEFVDLLKKQNQSSVTDLVIARLLAYAPNTFDSPMPDKAVEVIEKYAKIYNELIEHLSMEISNRRGSFTFDNGVSSLNYSLVFSQYATEHKKRGNKMTATLYRDLSKVFDHRAVDEQEQARIM